MHICCFYILLSANGRILLSTISCANKIPPPLKSLKEISHKDCITMCEPVMLNPNCYNSEQQILETIKSCRHFSQAWSIIGSNGVPYVLGHKLRDELPVLQDVLLCPGQGHYEMNFVKVLFKYLWPVGLHTLATKVGFNTPEGSPTCLSGY